MDPSPMPALLSDTHHPARLPADSLPAGGRPTPASPPAPTQRVLGDSPSPGLPRRANSEISQRLAFALTQRGLREWDRTVALEPTCDATTPSPLASSVARRRT